MGDLWTRKPSNAIAHHKAADFANGVRPFMIHVRLHVQSSIRRKVRIYGGVDVLVVALGGRRGCIARIGVV